MAGNLGPTARDLITDALTLLGVLAQGENADGADAATCLMTLSDILDGYGLEKLKRFQITPQSFVTVPNQASYTLGPGAGWNTATLPAGIDSATYYADPAHSLELPIKVLNRPEYDRFPLKSLSSSFLSACCVDLGAAAHTLTFYPVPTLAIAVNLYLGIPLTNYSDVNQVLGLPFGYREMLKYELALKCASKFGAPVPEALPQMFDDARHKVLSANFLGNLRDMEVDPALTGRYRGDSLLRFFEGK